MAQAMSMRAGVQPRLQVRNQIRAASCSRSHRLVVRAGLLDFFQPKAAAASNPRATELVEELIQLTRSTNAGSSANAERRDQIEELVAELQQYSIKNPARSKQLWGTYEVLYASNPTAPGGPLRTYKGAVAYGGKRPIQTLEEPNQVEQVVEFKSLGLLPSYYKQFGQIRGVTGNSFTLSITSDELKSGLGPAQAGEQEYDARVEVLYLDDTLRVARVTVEGEENSILYVYQRVEDAVEEEEQEDDDDQGSPLPFFGKPKAGTATLAERQVRKQLEAQRGAAAAGTRPLRSQSTEDARKEAERVKAQKAKEAEERERELRAARERAEAEKAAEREKQAAIKELLADLTEQLRERQAETKEAVKEVRDIERSNAAVLKQVAAARAQLEAAEQDTAGANEQLAAAMASKRDADAELKDAQAAVQQAQAKVRQAFVSVLNRK